MKLSKSFLLIPAASLLFAAAAGAVACSSTLTVGTPPGEEAVPTGFDWPAGITATTPCTEDTYYAVSGAWLLCVGGTYSEYTTDDPDTTGGWTAASGGDDATGDDDAKGDDATGDDDAKGDDATGDDATGDDATGDDGGGQGDDGGTQGDDGGVQGDDSGDK